MPDIALDFPFADPPAPGAVIEVAPGILWARLPLPYRLNHVNVYFIEDGGAWAIVDTGIGDEDCRAAWEALLAGPLAGARFSRLIVTHHHPDHIGLAGWLCDRLGVPLQTSLSSYLGCVNISLSPGAMEAQTYRDFYRSHGMSRDVADAVLTLGHGYLRMVTPLPASFRRLVQGDRLAMGGREFEVLTSEGHAQEQVMLHCRAANIFLPADEVLARITPNVSVWAVDPDGDPLGLFLRSLAMIEREVAEDALVLPGHHLPFRGLHKRTRELAEHHVERCARIAAACAERPQSVADLVPLLFPKVQDVHQLGFAFNEVHAHVNYMIYRGDLHQRSHNGIERVEAAG
ncbi:MBL fold metallo-hydrolase [Pararhodobacter sp.]|uniref:MBL fold metallo-hydrolase n=1 Tax=Pararhodobacter sp. TaxID=2127056 RepID=UPI002FE189AE